MTLLSRASRLLRADLNALLDRLEEPEALLRQAIRDMEEALLQSVQQLNAIDQQLAQNSSSRTQLESDLIELEQRLDTCFEHEEMDLARTIVKRRLLLCERQKSLSHQVEQLARQRAALEKLIEHQQNEVEDFKQRLKLLPSESEGTRNESPLGSNLDTNPLRPSASDALVEAELLRSRSRWEQAQVEPTAEKTQGDSV